jgi:hypothetical protein
MKQPDQKAEPTDDKENPTKKLDRRTFLRLGTLGAIGGSPCWGASVAQAAETPKPTVSDPPSPIVDARFPCRIADGCNVPRGQNRIIAKLRSCFESSWVIRLFKEKSLRFGHKICHN